MYIEEHVTAEALKRKAEQQADERQRKFSYYGTCAYMLLLWARTQLTCLPTQCHRLLVRAVLLSTRCSCHSCA